MRNSSAWYIQRKAAQELGRLGRREALEPLLRIITEDSPDAVIASDSLLTLARTNPKFFPTFGSMRKNKPVFHKGDAELRYDQLVRIVGEYQASAILNPKQK